MAMEEKTEEAFPSAAVLLSLVSLLKKKKEQGQQNKVPFQVLLSVVECIVSWVAALLLAGYLGYTYLVSISINARQKKELWQVPLVTIDRNNHGSVLQQGSNYRSQDAGCETERLLQELQAILIHVSGKKEDDDDDHPHNTNDASDETSHQQQSESLIPRDRLYDDQDLIRIMRSSVPARRVASLLALQPTTTTTQTNTDSKKTSAFLEQLQRIWPHLLQLPCIIQGDDNIDNDNPRKTWPYQISVIVPAFGEQGAVIQANLQRALNSSRQPQKLQLVVVDAGNNTDMDIATQFFPQQVDPSSNHISSNNSNDNNSKQWGDIKRISFSAGGGRGPTLNHGARHADGRILTFLHSDNILPDGWDEQILSTFDTNATSKTAANNNCDSSTHRRVIACAFSFRINCSKEALQGRECPPGLSAAQLLGTVRTRAFGAIYGDSVFSMPTEYFRYLGEYPPQGLMEDYELMDLLRKRTAALEDETVVILPSDTLVSPRRWQAHGVPYVILFNWLCVFLYVQRGWSSEELFRLYYGG